MKKFLLLILSITLILSTTGCMSENLKEKLQNTDTTIVDPVTTGGGITVTTDGGITVTTDGGITVTTDGGVTITTGSGITAEDQLFYLYSSSTGLATDVTINDWTSGAIISEETNFDGKSKVYKVVAGTPGWGAPTACIAFQGLGDLKATYESITFKIKSDDLTTVTAKIPQIEKSYAISSGTDLGNGWHELTIPFSAFEGADVGATEIGIHCGWGNVGTFYLTDVVLTKK